MNGSVASRGVVLRAFVPALAAGVAVLVVGLLYGLGYRAQYHALLQGWGAAPFGFPFLDMHGVTAAVECHRLGFDVYVENPCDVLQRTHNYSPLWLWLAKLPIDTGWTTVLGFAEVLLFIAALPLLPPGRSWGATVVITLATVSSDVMFRARQRRSHHLPARDALRIAEPAERVRQVHRLCGGAVCGDAEVLSDHADDPGSP